VPPRISVAGMYGTGFLKAISLKKPFFELFDQKLKGLMNIHMKLKGSKEL
jgi:hypothetical protein